MIAYGRHLSLSFYLLPSVGLLLTVWTRFSVRVIAHGKHLSLSFYLQPSVGLLLTVWTRFSVRVIAHGRHLSLSFYLPPSVGLLLTVWTRFSVRVYDRAWEPFSLPSIGLLEQFFERHHARATIEFAGWKSTRTTGSVLRFRFSLCFCFCLVLYQVEIVPYCIYMITLRHKPLYIKKTPI